MLQLTLQTCTVLCSSWILCVKLTYQNLNMSVCHFDASMDVSHWFFCNLLYIFSLPLDCKPWGEGLPGSVSSTCSGCQAHWKTGWNQYLSCSCSLTFVFYCGPWPPSACSGGWRQGKVSYSYSSLSSSFYNIESLLHCTEACGPAFSYTASIGTTGEWTNYDTGLCWIYLNCTNV